MAPAIPRLIPVARQEDNQVSTHQLHARPLSALPAAPPRRCQATLLLLPQFRATLSIVNPPSLFHILTDLDDSTNETTEAGTPILFRIDNGWDSPRYTRYDPVIKNPAPWFKHPRSLTRNPKVIVSLKAERYGDKKVLREEMLYEMLEPYFEGYVRGFWGWRKVVVTRHRWHLFEVV